MCPPQRRAGVGLRGPPPSSIDPRGQAPAHGGTWWPQDLPPASHARAAVFRGPGVLLALAVLSPGLAPAGMCVAEAATFPSRRDQGWRHHQGRERVSSPPALPAPALEWTWLSAGTPRACFCQPLAAPRVVGGAASLPVKPWHHLPAGCMRTRPFRASYPITEWAAAVCRGGEDRAEGPGVQVLTAFVPYSPPGPVPLGSASRQAACVSPGGRAPLRCLCHAPEPALAGGPAAAAGTCQP